MLGCSSGDGSSLQLAQQLVIDRTTDEQRRQCQAVADYLRPLTERALAEKKQRKGEAAAAAVHAVPEQVEVKRQAETASAAASEQQQTAAGRCVVS